MKRVNELKTKAVHFDKSSNNLIKNVYFNTKLVDKNKKWLEKEIQANTRAIEDCKNEVASAKQALATREQNLRDAQERQERLMDWMDTADLLKDRAREISTDSSLISYFREEKDETLDSHFHQRAREEINSLKENCKPIPLENEKYGSDEIRKPPQFSLRHPHYSTSTTPLSPASSLASTPSYTSTPLPLQSTLPPLQPILPLHQTIPPSSPSYQPIFPSSSSSDESLPVLDLIAPMTPPPPPPSSRLQSVGDGNGDEEIEAIVKTITKEIIHEELSDMVADLFVEKVSETITKKFETFHNSSQTDKMIKHIDRSISSTEHNKSQTNSPSGRITLQSISPSDRNTFQSNLPTTSGWNTLHSNSPSDRNTLQSNLPSTSGWNTLQSSTVLLQSHDSPKHNQSDTLPALIRSNELHSSSLIQSGEFFYILSVFFHILQDNINEKNTIEANPSVKKEISHISEVDEKKWRIDGSQIIKTIPADPPLTVEQKIQFLNVRVKLERIDKQKSMNTRRLRKKKRNKAKAEMNRNTNPLCLKR